MIVSELLLLHFQLNDTEITVTKRANVCKVVFLKETEIFCAIIVEILLLCNNILLQINFYQFLQSAINQTVLKGCSFCFLKHFTRHTSLSSLLNTFVL